ncbi:unnamed protein product [Sympodiomycopsis kandeliae]
MMDRVSNRCTHTRQVHYSYSSSHQRRFKMVCAKCEKKLTKVAASDPFRNRDVSGSLKTKPSASISSSSSSNSKSASASIGPTNKLLGNSNRFNPYKPSSSTSTALGSGGKCKICQAKVSLQGGTYCNSCAYKRGVCSICGKMLLDNKAKAGMKMSS